MFPPPEAEASEASYETLTAELKSRVVEMWKGLRAEGEQIKSEEKPTARAIP